ncbi:MAG: TonB-dependent receptor [Pseudomonadales bacterium]|nr:TonB-dependent receptor [Pseudomonadales bacterium]
MKHVSSAFKRSVIAVAVASVFSFYAEASDVPVIIVEGEKDVFSISLEKKNTVAPDSTELLKGMAGASVVKNGPLTGFAQYRGMYGQRINTVIDGATHTSGGPNWMDAPLHYAPASQVSNIRVYRGASPVSSGQETIGGSVIVETKSGEFVDSTEAVVSGEVSVGGETNNNATMVSALVTVANKNHWLSVKGLDEQADDMEFDGGEITPTEYERSRFDVGYGFRLGAHEIEIGGGRNETDDAGTPALPMDISSIDTDMVRAKYTYQGDDHAVEVLLFANDVEHGMTNHHLREAPGNMMGYRTAAAKGESQGGKVIFRSEGDLPFEVGIDVLQSEHSTDITNPNMPMFLVKNFNESTRDSVGVYVETAFELSDTLSLESGVRVNHIGMDSDEVSVAGTMGMMAMMVANMESLATSLNTSDRSQDDTLIDWVNTLTYKLSDDVAVLVGLARKNRAPSYQERYLWMPMESTGGLADGNTYIGDVDLDAELSHEINLGFDLSAGAFDVSPRIFYRDVDDFIQGVAVTEGTAFVLNGMQNTGRELLQFSNVDAKFYGFDMNWGYRFDSAWSLRGVVNYVRGKRRDVSDNLYRIAPANTLYALDYDTDKWGVSIENHLFAKQDNISEENNEQRTKGYGTVNISAYVLVTEAVSLTAGVENLLDKRYQDHLTGYNRAANDDIAINERLPLSLIHI